jgi:hypothetical protein
MSDNKDIADELRKIAGTFWGGYSNELRELADRLDPPKPKVDRSLRGLVRVTEKSGETWYRVAAEVGLVDAGVLSVTWDTVDTLGWTVTPVRVLADDEVAVKVPPVELWPESCDKMIRMYMNGGVLLDRATIITRTEAEALHRGRA